MSSLQQAVEDLCEQLRKHAEVCEQHADNPVAVIRQTDQVREAALAYEAALMASSGWSSPLRHLDPDEEADDLPPVSDDAPSDPSEGPHNIQLHARYYLRVDDAEGLSDFVSRKLGIRTSAPAAAVMALHEADGWKPDAYPIDLITVDDIAVDSWNEPEPS